LALLRASQHIRILCIALLAIAPAAAGYSHTWVAIPRRRESALIFGAFLTAMLLIRATVEESSHATSIRERLLGMGPAQRAGWAPLSSRVLGAVLNVGTMAILSPMVPADFSTSPGRGFNRDYGNY
jgi:hypothetical protein